MKKLLAILLIAIMATCMLSIGASAADTASKNPANICGQTTYATKSLVSFDEADIVDRMEPEAPGNNADCTFDLVDGLVGKALKITAQSGWAQGYITHEGTDFSQFDGLLYYVDLSGVNVNPEKTAIGQPNGVGIRLYSNIAQGCAWTRNTYTPKLDHEIKVYYLDGSEWKICDETKQNGERQMLPANYVGWVYIPFSSYVSTAGPDGNPVAGMVYGAEEVGKLMILTGMYNKENTVMLFDEFQLVKLGVTEITEPTEPATTAPETTAPETKAPETTAKVEDDTTAKVENTTAAPSTEAPAKSGCGSSITVASVAVVMTAVFGSALVIKKNK